MISIKGTFCQHNFTIIKRYKLIFSTNERHVGEKKVSAENRKGKIVMTKSIDQWKEKIEINENPTTTWLQKPLLHTTTSDWIITIAMSLWFYFIFFPKPSLHHAPSIAYSSLLIFLPRQNRILIFCHIRHIGKQNVYLVWHKWEPYTYWKFSEDSCDFYKTKSGGLRHYTITQHAMNWWRREVLEFHQPNYPQPYQLLNVRETIWILFYLPTRLWVPCFGWSEHFI